MEHGYGTDAAQARLVAALQAQRLVGGSPQLAARLAEAGETRAVAPGENLIEQGASDSDIYFILAGNFAVLVNGRKVAALFAGQHVGEMSAVDPTMPRSATVTAETSAVVHRIAAGDFAKLAQDHAELWRHVALELTRRLETRNFAAHDAVAVPRVLVITADAGLAAALGQQLDGEAMTIATWTDDYDPGSPQALQLLGAHVHDADFVVLSGTGRGGPDYDAGFEAGFAIGRLGAERVVRVDGQPEAAAAAVRAAVREFGVRD